MYRTKLTRRALLRAAGLTGAAAYLSACGGATPAPTTAPAASTKAPDAKAEPTKPAAAPPQPKSPVELQIAYTGRVDRVDMHDALMRLFAEDHPSIKLKPLHMPDQYTQKLLAMFAAGNPPDSMELATDQWIQFVEQDVLYPMDDLMKRDQGKDFDVNDLFAFSQKNFTYKAKTYGVLLSVAPYTIWYNGDMFKSAGIPSPDGTWDFDQFLETAKKLTVDSNKDGKPEVFGYGPHLTQDYYCWIWCAGAEYLMENNGKYKANFSDPKIVEVLQLLQDMRFKHRVSPTPNEAQAFGLTNIAEETLFINKKAAMIDESFGEVRVFRGTKDMFEWNPTPFPVKKGVKRQVLGKTECRSISKACKEPEAAWEWLKFLLGEKATKLYAEVGMWIPASKKLASSPLFLNPKMPPTNMKYFLDAMEYSRPRPLYSRYGEIQPIYYAIMEKIWDGSTKAVDACKQMDEKVNAKLQEWGQLSA